MINNNIKKNSIHLANSDENILQVLEQSNTYLESHNELANKIEEILEIFRTLEDLVPKTTENIVSGHMFPLIEANFELENSITLCKFGFYKHALIALRSVLELGFLSVYWDIDGKSQVDINNWLLSLENTPGRRKIFTKLKTNQNILKFDNKHQFFVDGDNLFKQLSDFVHTKGHRHSSINLGNANFNRFIENSLLGWFQLLIKVAKFTTILHILKYPVALQYTPIEQKFGINGPVGTFLEPFQVERIRRFFDRDVIETLQEISNNDPEAKSLAQWVNDQPDISEEERRIQLEEFEKMHKNLKR